MAHVPGAAGSTSPSGHLAGNGVSGPPARRAGACPRFTEGRPGTEAGGRRPHSWSRVQCDLDPWTLGCARLGFWVTPAPFRGKNLSEESLDQRLVWFPDSPEPPPEEALPRVLLLTTSRMLPRQAQTNARTPPFSVLPWHPNSSIGADKA